MPVRVPLAIVWRITVLSRSGMGGRVARWSLRALVLLLLVGPGLTAPPAMLVWTAAQGDRELAAGRPQAALAHYQTVLAHAEGRPAVALPMAQALLTLAQGDANDQGTAFGMALAAWLDAIRYHGMTTSVKRGLAECYLGLGQTLAAADLWGQVYADEPTEPGLWSQLAPAHLQNQEWDAAGRAFSALAATEPANGEYVYWAGLLTLRSTTGSLSVAQDSLGAALTDPVYAKRAGAVLKVVDELASIQHRAYRHARLGIAFLGVGEPGLAEHELLQAVDHEPALADAWAYLGLARDQLGQEGWHPLSIALDLSPASPLTHSLVGHHWLEKSRIAAARSAFLTAWHLDPNFPTVPADIAHTYRLEDDLASAEAWYQQGVRQHPADSVAWVLLARFYLETRHGSSDAGMMAAQRAVALAPTSAAALDTLGWAQTLAGQYRLAENNLWAAENLDPHNPSILYHQALFHWNQHQWVEARAAFERTILLDYGCRGCRPPRSGPWAELARRAIDSLRP